MTPVTQTRCTRTARTTGSRRAQLWGTTSRPSPRAIPRRGGSPTRVVRARAHCRTLPPGRHPILRHRRASSSTGGIGSCSTTPRKAVIRLTPDSAASRWRRRRRSALPSSPTPRPARSTLQPGGRSARPESLHRSRDRSGLSALEDQRRWWVRCAVSDLHCSIGRQWHGHRRTRQGAAYGRPAPTALGDHDGRPADGLGLRLLRSPLLRRGTSRRRVTTRPWPHARVRSVHAPSRQHRS